MRRGDVHPGLAKARPGCRAQDYWDWTNRSDEIGSFLAEHGRYGIPFYLLYRPGNPPHVFSELLNKETLVSEVEATAAGRVAER